MKINFEKSRIFVRPGTTDLRKGVTGLTYLIEKKMKQKSLNGDIFLFCNKTHRLLKVIFWDKTGFWLAQKRLENATWPWPKTEEEAKEITTEQLKMLLAGIDFWKAHQEVKFQEAF